MNVALHWFRCDLRLEDNTALHAATTNADVVVPIFILDSRILAAAETGAPLVGFMLECLACLQKNIEAKGGNLIFRHGHAEEEIRRLLLETKACALYFNRDYEPGARQRDSAVEKMARSMGIKAHSFKDGVLHEPDEVLKSDGQPYRVFTAYSHAWMTRPKPPILPPVKFFRPPDFKDPASLLLPSATKLGFKVPIPLPPAGEHAARARLNKFADSHLAEYANLRDFPARDATSHLSPHLRLGTLSPRTVLSVAWQPASERQTRQSFINELIWRDFYRQILWHFPHVAVASFKEQYNDLKWENDERLFAAWCEGRTGFPIVDAGMRQLNTTGWMHNRVRMIVAMFLTKDLLISWQWGEHFFMQKLIDADLASNNGGWQWSASTGTDAQPYFRIFNPIAQAQKFDPEGRYIRQYVPEVDTLKYPAPVVDHARQRLKALALFKR